MERKGALLACCFSAGVLGGLFNSLAAWTAGHWGLTIAAGVALSPQLTLAWLYPRLVWGGLWGVLLYLFVSGPRQRHGWIRKGLWLSLLPTTMQLFYVFPRLTDKGMLGLELGTLTPLFVLLFNFVWGFFTGTFARLLWGRG